MEYYEIRKILKIGVKKTSVFSNPSVSVHQHLKSQTKHNRMDWQDEIFELEKQLEKKLCISLKPEKTPPNSEEKIDINQMLLDDLNDNLNELPIFPIYQEADLISFAPACWEHRSQELNDLDVWDIHQEVTFNPQNFTESQEQQEKQILFKRRGSYNTSKPMIKLIRKQRFKQKKLHQ